VSITAAQALIVLTWFAVTILLLLLLLIARFYQNVSGERTYYWGFMLPIILFGVASARSAFIDQIGGDPLSDSLWFVGGLILIGLCIFLIRLMTDGR
jgi:hypothetical protein